MKERDRGQGKPDGAPQSRNGRNKGGRNQDGRNGRNGRNSRNGRGKARSKNTPRLVRRIRRGARRRMAVRAGRARIVTTQIRLGTARNSPLLRRGVLAAVLVAVALVPYPALGPQAAGTIAPCRGGCHTGSMIRWASPLPGSWDVQSGVAGTVPAGGVAYAAAGNGLAVVAEGLAIEAYTEQRGRPLWSQALTGFPAGAAITSVRTWPGEVTVGVTYQGTGSAAGTQQRAELSLRASDGVQTGQYQAAPFGGAVAGGAAYTVVIGAQAVTSYANGTGKVRWRRTTDQVTDAWQADGQYLYLAVSGGGYLASGPVSELRRIDLSTGTETEVLPTSAEGTGTAMAFDGALATAADGVVLFSAAAGVTAYDSSTGIRLWQQPGVVPEGSDPVRGRLYLTRGATLLEVDPRSGQVLAQAQEQAGQSGMYVVRNGVALGLDQGADGAAWGFDLAEQRVVVAASGLGWPHYFTDLDEAGGSTDPASGLVIIAACRQLAPGGQPGPAPGVPSSPGPAGLPGPAASTSPSASPSPALSPAPPQGCQLPELVALSL